MDERGFFTELYRNDWTELFGEDKVVQANMSVSFPGMIRAWHRHERGQVDYFLVLQGTVKICAYDEKNGEINEIISSGENPQIVRVPGFYWHGFKNVGDTRSLVVYFVNILYDSHSPDELRRPWNDPTLILSSTGKPYDWNAPPHK